jgi:hypothetical protein
MRPALFILTIAALPLLGACSATTGTGPAFKSFVNDPRGACFAERRELEREGTRFDESLASGAGDSSVVAVAERYLAVLLSGERSLAETAALVTADLERETTWIGWTADAFETLTACRRASALAVNNRVRAGQIDRATAERRLAEIRDLYREDTARFRRFADRIALNNAAFAEVQTEFALAAGAAPIVVALVLGVCSAPKPARPAPKRRARLVRAAPSDSTAPAVRPALAALNGALLTNTRKRDEVFQQIERARAVEDSFDLAAVDTPRTRIA